MCSFATSASEIIVDVAVGLDAIVGASAYVFRSKDTKLSQKPSWKKLRDINFPVKFNSKLPYKSFREEVLRNFPGLIASELAKGILKEHTEWKCPIKPQKKPMLALQSSPASKKRDSATLGEVTESVAKRLKVEKVEKKQAPSQPAPAAQTIVINVDEDQPEPGFDD